MNAIDALMTRRSIRSYTPRPVEAAQVDTLLRVLMQSPSAADARPWHFVVVDRRDLLDALAARMPGCEMLNQATLGLLICADPSLEEIPGFWPQDCSAAAENGLLAVTALGLGGCWIGLHPVEERVAAVREVLGIPEGPVPFALLSIGHPAESPGREDRYDEAKAHRNGW